MTLRYFNTDALNQPETFHNAQNHHVGLQLGLEEHLNFKLRDPTAVITKNHNPLTLRIPSSGTNAFHTCKSYFPNTAKDWNLLPYLKAVDTIGIYSK